MNDDRAAEEPLSLDTIIGVLRRAGCVFAEAEADLLMREAPSPRALRDLIARRVAGEPLEHVLGWASFAGLRVSVDAGVFVPRRRSECLVDRALALAPQDGAITVVDLCAGSGALGLAVASGHPGTRLYATDIDPVAVVCARRNITTLGGLVYQGDLFTALPPALRGTIDLVLANVPYVPTEDMPLLPYEARAHEDSRALDGGPDGLRVVRLVAQAAPDWLAPGGHVLMEISARQATAAEAAVREAGLRASVIRCPPQDATIVIGTRISP